MSGGASCVSVQTLTVAGVERGREQTKAWKIGWKVDEKEDRRDRCWLPRPFISGNENV